MMERVLHHEGQPAAAAFICCTTNWAVFCGYPALLDVLALVRFVLKHHQKGQTTWSCQVGVHGV